MACRWWQNCLNQDELCSAARRPQRIRSPLIASDFTLPRSRRRASSPGARSELSSRRVRRRLVRSGDRLQPGRSGSRTQQLDSDADSILNALERSISARDHAGLSTTAEHRSVTCQQKHLLLHSHHRCCIAYYVVCHHPGTCDNQDAVRMLGLQTSFLVRWCKYCIAYGNDSCMLQ